MSISGEYSCASNTILNPPDCTHNPAYDLTAKNWQDANVDQLMYDWWFDYTSDTCDKDYLGASGLKGVSPPDTTKDLVNGQNLVQTSVMTANPIILGVTIGLSGCEHQRLRLYNGCDAKFLRL